MLERVALMDLFPKVNCIFFCDVGLELRIYSGVQTRDAEPSEMQRDSHANGKIAMLPR